MEEEEEQFVWFGGGRGEGLVWRKMRSSWGKGRRRGFSLEEEEEERVWFGGRLANVPCCC